MAMDKYGLWGSFVDGKFILNSNLHLPYTTGLVSFSRPVHQSTNAIPILVKPSEELKKNSPYHEVRHPVQYDIKVITRSTFAAVTGAYQRCSYSSSQSRISVPE